MKARWIAPALVLSLVSMLCIAATGGATDRPSPNTRVVFHGFNSTRSIPPNGGRARTLFVPPSGPDPIREIVDVAASTNGNRLAAVTSKINGGPGGGIIRAILVFRGDGSHPQVQVPGSTTNGTGSVAISSDGKKVVFPYKGFLWISDFGSRAKRRITATAGHYKNPALSGDGKLVAFQDNTA